VFIAKIEEKGTMFRNPNFVPSEKDQGQAQKPAKRGKILTYIIVLTVISCKREKQLFHMNRLDVCMQQQAIIS